MKKITFLLLFFSVVILGMTSCSRNPLKQQTESLKSSLPLKFSEWASVTEANYDEKQNAVNLVVEIKGGDRVKMDQVEKQKVDLGKGMALFFYGDKGSLHGLAQSIVDHKAGLSFTFRDSQTKKDVNTLLSPKDAAQLLGTQVPPVEELKGKVAIANLTVPNDFDDFSKLGEMTVDKDNLTVTLLVDSKAFDARLTPKELKTYIAQNVLIDQDLQEFTSLAAKAGLGVIFDYQDAGSGKKLTTGFSKDELNQ